MLQRKNPRANAEGKKSDLAAIARRRRNALVYFPEEAQLPDGGSASKNYRNHSRAISEAYYKSPDFARHRELKQEMWRLNKEISKADAKSMLLKLSIIP